MDIKVLERSDNIAQYLECVESLNNKDILLSNVDQIKSILSIRPTNILTFIGIVDFNIVATATTIMERKLRYNQLCCHIEDVGVHPLFRKKGYGKEIVQYCVDMAKFNKCYKVKLNCKKDLVDFYVKLGFVDNEQHMIYHLSEGVDS